MPVIAWRIAGAVLIAAGAALVLARRRLAVWWLRFRGEPAPQEDDDRAYGAPFMVAGDILIAVGALLLLGITPQPR